MQWGHPQPRSGEGDGQRDEEKPGSRVSGRGRAADQAVARRVAGQASRVAAAEVRRLVVAATPR
jgi:hypothetical protein